MPTRVTDRNPGFRSVQQSGTLRWIFVADLVQQFWTKGEFTH